MQNKWLTMVLIVSLAMNAAFVAVAGYGYFHNRGRMRSDTGHLADKGNHFYEMLGLTQDQLTQMTPMAESFHGQVNRLHADMRIKKESMIRMLRGEKAAEERVEALRGEMAAIQDRIQKEVIAHILDVKEILDSDQQEHFFDLLHERMIQDHPMFIHTGDK